MPGERGALYTHRKLAHAGEDPEVAELVRRLFIQLTSNHAVKFREQFVRPEVGVYLSRPDLMLAAAFEIAHPDPSKATS